MKNKKIWFAVLVVVLLAFIVPTDEPEEPKAPEKVEEKEKVNPNGFTDDEISTYVTITQSISDEYLSNYKSPWSFDDWNIAKFDDEGNIIVTTKYTLKDVTDKQDVMCVFHWDEGKEAYTAHFLSVGTHVFLDDGYCDEFFENINGILE